MNLLSKHYSKYDPYTLAFYCNLDPISMHVIKYITRFRKKGGFRDLEAAKHSLDRLVELFHYYSYNPENHKEAVDTYCKENSCTKLQTLIIKEFIDVLDIENSMYGLDIGRLEGIKLMINRLADKEYPNEVTRQIHLFQYTNFSPR